MATRSDAIYYANDLPARSAGRRGSSCRTPPQAQKGCALHTGANRLPRPVESKGTPVVLGDRRKAGCTTVFFAVLVDNLISHAGSIRDSLAPLAQTSKAADRVGVSPRQ